ncbi:hypothetical protein ES703_87871 [subsurface metagenome]
MILKYIAKSARFIIIARPVFDTDCFSYRDLYIVDVIAVPNRLKNCIGKPEHQDILNGFLTEVMVDTVYLRFIKTVSQLVVQFESALKVPSKRFFNNQLDLLFCARLLLTTQPSRAQMLHYRGVQERRNRQIIDKTFVDFVLLVQLG